ncbi:MAG: ATP-binding protein [Pyrinomonadaceae bacterium]|nr:ATP-binding protein [Pyrinomonadaceae bacterium]
MNELQTDFIRQTVAEIETLAVKIQTENPSPEFLQEIFRKLHSIKGTAQVFGMNKVAELAHKLEDAAASEHFQTILPDGFAFLKKSLENEAFQIPDSFNQKLNGSQPKATPENAKLFEKIPHQFTAQLSESERSKLNSLLEHGNSLFVFEIGFEPPEFLEGFKGFRHNLEKKGEIVASLPCPKFSAESKIGFQIIFATTENINETIDSSPAEIVFQTPEDHFDRLEKLIARIVAHGNELAAKLVKRIDFQIHLDARTRSPKTLKLIFEILLHLVRNAVDHGIDKNGKVEISIKTIENKLILRVSDNGKGLDLSQIRAKAIEKNMIAENVDLSAEELKNFIFQPDFSTAETISEISGRGIGLDAVKNLVENANGKISVESVEKTGTAFEIFLPGII